MKNLIVPIALALLCSVADSHAFATELLCHGFRSVKEAPNFFNDPLTHDAHVFYERGSDKYSLRAGITRACADLYPNASKEELKEKCVKEMPVTCENDVSKPNEIFECSLSILGGLTGNMIMDQAFGRGQTLREAQLESLKDCTAKYNAEPGVLARFRNSERLNVCQSVYDGTQTRHLLSCKKLTAEEVAEIRDEQAAQADGNAAIDSIQRQASGLEAQ